MKFLRNILQKPYEEKHTTEGVSEFPNEAARQAMNFHEYLYENDPEREKKLNDFYKKHNLRKVSLFDAEENPHIVAHYLNTMSKHFPNISKEFNHVPMTVENNKRIVSKSIPIKHKIENMIIDSLPKRMKNKIMDNKMKKLLATISELEKSSDVFNTSLKKAERKTLEDWHRANPQLHHLSSSQVHKTFEYDTANSIANGMVRPMRLKEFAIHWKRLTGND